MKYEYKAVSADFRTDLEELNKLGSEGWEVCGLIGNQALLKKCASGGPTGCAKACGNCKLFKPVQPTEKSNGEVPSGWCEKWKLAMSVMGACDEFAMKDLPGAPVPIPAGALQDENSAWHWQPKTELGEKRIEAITSQVAGVKAPSHKHEVILIVDKNRNVIRGKTNMVNGHEHTVSYLGMTGEADGHTHTFDVPQMVGDTRTTEFSGEKQVR